MNFYLRVMKINTSFRLLSFPIIMNKKSLVIFEDLRHRRTRFTVLQFNDDLFCPDILSIIAHGQ